MTGEPRVLVIGYYGDGNAGDEAVLTAMMCGLRRARPDLQFTVPAYSTDPAPLRQTHGVESFPFRDIGRMLDAVDDADLVIVGGGGLLHDYVDPRPETMFTARHFGLSYYCGIPWLASHLGKPVMLYAVGVGPLLYPGGRHLTRDAAQAAHAITVRDAESAAVLRGLAGEALDVEVTADPVWQLVPSEGVRRERLLVEAGIAGRRWLGVAARNWNHGGIRQASWEAELLAAIAPFAARHELGILFLPFQHAHTGLQNDVDLARRLSGQVRDVPAAVLEGVGPEDLAGVLGACELVVAMRLHSLIFACMTGTPFVALDYDPKVPIHARLLDPAPPVLPIGELTAADLGVALDEVWCGRQNWSDRGSALAAAMRKRAVRNDEVAAALLDTTPRALPRRLRRRILAALREREELRAADRPAEETDALRAPAWPPAISASRIPERVSREVRIIAPAFFDPRGEHVIRGGAERYLTELARTVVTLGFPVEVFQPAAEPWVREANGVRVHGLPVESVAGLDRAVLSVTSSRPLLTIHLAFYTAGADTPRPALGISHGVYWDDPASQTRAQFRWHRTRVLQSLEYLDAAVSVDTNTINWVGAMSSRLADKMVYLPNFVDVETFRPAAPRSGETVVLLFPRRLVPARGFWLVADFVADVLADHPEMEIHFVGEGAGAEAEEAHRLVNLAPGRVHWRSLPPERMLEAYEAADIVLVPSLHSEGTSLSVLEAQAAGRAVVATRVGGLPDLILDDFNGLLIEPDAGALRAAIERLTRSPELRERLRQHALVTVQRFAIDRWRARWRDVLRTFLPVERDTMDEMRFPDETSARTRLFEMEAALARARADAAERDIGTRLAMYDRDAQLAAAEERLRATQADLDTFERQLRALEQTLGHRLISRFWLLKRRLLPEGSRRSKFYAIGRRAAAGLLGLRGTTQETSPDGQGGRP